MFGLQLPEIILILLVVGVLFFGSQKITDFARSIGRASGEFKKGKRQVEEELRKSEEEVTSDKIAEK